MHQHKDHKRPYIQRYCLCFLIAILALQASGASASVFSRFAIRKPSAIASASIDSSTGTGSSAAPSNDDWTRQVLDRFEELKRLPLVARRSSILNSTVEVRVTWHDEKNTVTYCHVPHVAIPPSLFQRYFENIATEMPQADVMVKSSQAIEQGRAIKVILHAPFPCSNRLIMAWKHSTQPAPNQHVLFVTNRNNQQLLDQYQTPQEQKTLVEAKASIAYWIQPVLDDDNQNVIGSSIQYLFQGDIGGNIPKWLKHAGVPRGAYDTVHGLLKHLHKKQPKDQ